MDELHSIFSESLGLTSPFSLSKIEKRREESQIIDITFIIEISKIIGLVSFIIFIPIMKRPGST